MARTVMAEPAVLDPENEAPCHILSAHAARIDRPMLAAFVLTATVGALNARMIAPRSSGSVAPTSRMISWASVVVI
jgi:hypothetical protein